MTPQKPNHQHISKTARSERQEKGRTVQLGNEICEVQRAEEREVACFGAEETRLLVLRCGVFC
jgi:hypothetical protein